MRNHKIFLGSNFALVLLSILVHGEKEELYFFVLFCCFFYVKIVAGNCSKKLIPVLALMSNWSVAGEPRVHGWCQCHKVPEVINLK